MTGNFKEDLARLINKKPSTIAAIGERICFLRRLSLLTEKSDGARLIRWQLMRDWRKAAV